MARAVNERFVSVAIEFTVLLAELAVLLVVVAVLLAITARRVGVVRLRGWLGGGRVRGALKGILLGFVTPFCTYSAIPVVVGMIDAGLRTATVAGFLLAAPLLDPIVLAVLVLLFGWQAAAGYALVTFCGVLVAALLADSVHLERALRPTPARAGAHGAPDPVDGSAGCVPAASDPFTDRAPWRGWGNEARAAIGYALRLARGLALPMVVAVALAAAIVELVPHEVVGRLAGPDNPFAVPAAALLGAPFYVSTEAFLPIAAALHDNGMRLGAVFALVISASGVNIPELVLLGRVMSVRLLASYTAAVIGVAVAAGYLVPPLL